MEVATIITSEIRVLSMFDTFIYSFPMVYLARKDSDTAFFVGIINNKDKLYYHFKLDDTEQELSINYSKDQVILIKNKFVYQQIFMLDLSYSTENLLQQTIKAFKEYLTIQDKDLIVNMLIGHPFHGIENIETDY